MELAPNGSGHKHRNLKLKMPLTNFHCNFLKLIFY